MSQPRFDPAGFYQFNLADGAVRTRAGGRVLVLSDSAIAPLISTAVQHGDLTAVRRLGKQIGDQIVDSLGGPADERPPETVLGHAASVLALFGWGRLSLVRFGDALVARVEGAPALDEDHLGVAALLGGVFSSLAHREVACVPVDAERFLLVSPHVAEQVWTWSKEGHGLAAIIDRLDVGEEA